MTYLKFLQATLLSNSIFIMGTASSVAMNDESDKKAIPSKQIQASASSSSGTQPDAHEEDDKGPLYTLSTIGEALNEIDTPSGVPVSAPSSSSSSSIQPDVPIYDSVGEYQRHQYSSNRFLRRHTRKPELKSIIVSFGQQIRGHHISEGEKGNHFSLPNVPLTPINLDGLSSRTRILLFTELTTCAFAQEICIPFIFHGKSFKIKLEPSLRQPGDGRIITPEDETKGCSGITYPEIYSILHSYSPEHQQVASEKLMNARRAKPYHPAISDPILSREGQSMDLEILNILLDFEVARRLQGNTDEEQIKIFPEIIAYNNKINEKRAREVEMKGWKIETKEWKIGYMQRDKDSHDSVPVASAIVGALKLSRNENPRPLEVFFHASGIPVHAPDGSVFPNGEFNAFQGAPMERHRAQATKRIIKELRGGENAQNSLREDIHKEYLEIFGGESESDGEDYDKM